MKHNDELSCAAASGWAERRHRHSPDPPASLGVNSNSYYDARQAGIFDSFSTTVILIQSFSLLWYSGSSFHR